ncbi:hypothetical protein SAMN02745146_2943 [Hymenobacter daecheongensis DSM 21074]|uniref:Uncharacterized protein n=1 Tax=Hymenobacter daecheongensis DSM 21074 TaxID=1121955 RepID=A0A1M6IRB2_9BACT|nr:hypothetical protein [Hymenobacter daecheongensis]SHJ36984.1 hypothetical protein SAMN02745146_2943 [Hymenobacter daecheongensis DSM 21074]
MDRKQAAQVLRHRKVAEVLDLYPQETEAVAAFAEVAEEFRQKLALVAGLSPRRKSEGATEQKGLHRDALTAGLVKAANALYLLYKKEKNLEAARTLPRTRSDYRNLSALLFNEQAAAVSKAATQRVASLKSYNLSPDAVQQLATAAQTYNDSIDKPKTATEAGKVTTAATAQLIQDLNRYLKDDFRSATELLTDTHPLLYARLREAMRVDDASYGRSAAAKARKAAKAAADSETAPSVG